MRRLMCAALIAVSIFPGGATAAPKSNASAQRCADALPVYEKAYGPEIEDLSRNPSAEIPLADQHAESRAMIAKCAPGPARDAALAYIMAESAGMKHPRPSSTWHDDANLARQLLRKVRARTRERATARNARPPASAYPDGSPPGVP